MRLETARAFALSLPETSEEPHFDMMSFRVRGKIFMTVPPDGKHLHVFVDEATTRALVTQNGDAFAELWWGTRLSGVRIRLAAAGADEVRELVEDAWRRRAPKRVAAALDAERAGKPTERDHVRRS